MRSRPRAGIWALTLLFLVLLSLPAIAGSAAEPAVKDDPRPSTLRAVFASFPDYMDPQLSYTQEGWTAMRNTYIPLLTYRSAEGQAGSEVVPGLAEALPQVSDGGRTYTLRLRPGLLYSDGTPVRASDFEFTVKRMFQLESGGSPFFTVIRGAGRYARTLRGGIPGIRADDRSGRITIHLAEPDGTLPALLALPFAALVPAGTPFADTSADPPPATGPYVITESSPGFGWSYQRNPAWTSTNAALLPKIPGGHVDKIAVRVVRDPRAEVRAVERGAVDWMQNPPPTVDIPRLKQRFGGKRFRIDPTQSVYYFWFNTRRAPFNDIRVRRAVNYSIRPAAMRAIYGDQIEPLHQILPPGMPGHRPYDLYPYDPAEARRLIAAADPVDRKVTVWTSSESPNAEAGIYLTDVLRRLGFRPRLKIVNADSYFTVIGNRRTPNLDIGWSDWFVDFPHPSDFFGPLLRGSSILPTNNGNFALLDVPSLDAEAERLRRRPLTPETERDFAALDRAYMRRAPWAPYGAYSLTTFVSRRVAFDDLIWNPLFGAELTSFRLR